MLLKQPLFRSCLAIVWLLLPLVFFAQRTSPSSFQKLQHHQDVRTATYSAERGTPGTIELNVLPAGKRASGAVPALVKDLFGLDGADDEIRFERATAGSANLTVDKYQRLYRGITVEHDRYNVLSNEDGPRLITAENYDLSDGVDISPTLSRDAALVKALAHVGAGQYAWEQIEQDYVRHVWSRDLVATINRELEAVQPGGELTIVDNYGTEAVDLDLAWKFNVYAAQPLSRAWIYVNAHTGEIMLVNRIIKHASVPTTVVTRYAGTRDIMVDLETSGNDPHNGLPLLDSRTNAPAAGPLYVLRDDTRGDGLETYDLNGAGGIPLSLPALYAQGKAFTDNDLLWTQAEHKRGGTFNEAENDDIAWDAHWGTQVVYDYWLDVHGRNSYDDNGVAIKSFLHYGVAYDNAFWNGTAMTYGDGSYQGGLNPDGTFAPLMSLDVCGHEIGHAICTFTADLVYAKESGAMNEGFSDIWGAAIEAYAFREVDASLAATMAPFGIGEQIDERDGGIQYPAAGWLALRYMDEPGRAGDPDTYGGANWANPDCEPNLANDQCGVHTNSGVLNKWFFLLTAGETGTNDLGDNYATGGVGFELSERIAYGTELMLTPNATFAEARAASIAFVRTMPTGDGGGPCGNLEVQVTNSWYGVGVGPTFACGVAAGFVQDASSVGELVSDDNSCDASKPYFVEAAINSSGTVTVSGTATEGEDFSIANPNYSLGGGLFASHVFVVNIFDDAVIEGEETIILTLAGGSTHTITLIDNDVDLTIGGANVTLLDAATNNTGWSTVTLLDGPNSFYKTATGGEVAIEAVGSGAVYEGNTAADDIILSTPLIDARGLRDLNLSFSWTAGGETDVPTDVEESSDGAPAPVAVPLDYGNLAYSFDGVQWTDFTGLQTFNGILLSIATGTFSQNLPDVVQGTRFYLGFRWRNDALVGGVYSFSFENPVLTASGIGIATEVVSVEENLGPDESIFLLDDTGTEVLAKVSNTGGHDFGCTTVEITTSGSGATSFSEDGDYLDKTISVTPTNNNAAAGYEITLYYTEAEVSGYEAASTNDRNSVSLFKTPEEVASAGFTDVTMAEGTALATLNGGVAFTGSFSSGFSSFAVGAPQAVLPVTLTEFFAEPSGKNVNLTWKTSLEENNEGFSIERSVGEASNFEAIGWVGAAESRSAASSYRYVDEAITAGRTYFYRLRQQDFDGSFSYSEIRRVTIAGTLLSVFPNPTSGVLIVNLTAEQQEAGTTLSLLSSTGKVLLQQSANSGRSLSLADYPPGVYLLRVTTASGSQEVRRIVKE